MENLKITFKEWDYTCPDGCCHNYGIKILINDKEVEHYNEEITDNRYVGVDVQTALISVLYHLGYDVDVDVE